MHYINHDLIRAESWLERRAFVHRWAEIGLRDRRWTPPLFFKLRPALGDAHMRRVLATCFRFTAVGLERKQTFQGHPAQTMPIAPLIEETVATAVFQLDPRRTDRTAHFSLFRTINDRSSLRLFMDSVGEHLREAGSFRVLGPFGLSPHLERGVLHTHWDTSHPVYTAYNQPFMPELMDGVLRPFATQHLYTLPINPTHAPSNSIELTQFDPQRLATDLLPLFQIACQNRLGVPLPDEAEAAFILRLLLHDQLMVWGALLNGRIVGFMLLQPDDGAARRRARGGKLLWQVGLYHLLRRRPTARGRLLFGGVLPNMRQQGVGRALLHKLQMIGTDQGWKAVDAGPFDGRETAVSFLTNHANATPLQQYVIYEYFL